MIRIRRVIESGTVILIVSGRIGSAALPDLRELIQREKGAERVLDLAEVNLVDAEAVRFLAECEAQGIRLAQCPAYIREWILCENGTSS